MPKLLSDLSSSKTTALVAGGAGFVGSFLCEQLLALDTQVICVDNFISGKHENVSDLIRDENYFLIERDVNDRGFLDELILPVKINYIFHLASVEEYSGEEARHLNILETNSRGVENLLNLAVKYNSKFLFTSSLDVHNSNHSPAYLNEDLSEEHKWDNEGYHEGKRFSELLISDYFKRFKLDLRVVRLGQVYGPRMNTSSVNVPGIIIDQAVNKGVVTLPATSETIFPVYVSDTVAGILRAMFVPGSTGEIYSLFSTKGQSIIDFAHQVKKIMIEQYHKEIVIEFGPTSYKRNTGPIKDINYPSGWGPMITIEEGVERTIKWVSEKSKGSSISPTSVKNLSEPRRINSVNSKTTFAKEEYSSAGANPALTINKNEPSEYLVQKTTRYFEFRKGILRAIKIILLAAIIGLNLTALIFGFYIFSCSQSIKNIQKYIKKGEFTSLRTESRKLITSASAASSLLRDLNDPLNSIGLSKKVVFGEKALDLAVVVGESLISLVDLAENGSTLSEYVIGNNDLEPKEALAKLELQNEYSLEKITLVQGILSTFTGQEVIIGKNILELKRIVPEIKLGLLSLRDLLTIAPSLSGLDGKVSYLVLFQNNMELRPGGGFIGSYAIADLVNGKLANFKVSDVYAADGQLKGHVEPPAKLKEYLNVDGWYLRDSNWSVDFPENAIKAEWFLGKETGIEVDGVVSVNLNVIQRILRAINEVYLPDYDEKINADNIFEKAEYRVEAGFFPGSSQKGDYLGNVSRVIMEKIRNSDKPTQAKIIHAIFESINQKEIMIYGHDQDVAKVLARNNWDGSVKMPNCIKRENGCFRDYLMINDANVGVNKANYYLKKEMSQDIYISSSGSVEETVNIKYENLSPNNIFPAGDYKSFTRVLVPPGSAIKNCILYLQENDLSPQKCEVFTSVESGRMAIGVFVNVPVGEKRKITISYSLPREMVFLGGEYLLFTQKQSGALGDKYQVSLTFPENLSLVWSNQSLLTKNGKIVYNTSLSKDTSLEIGFEKRQD